MMKAITMYKCPICGYISDKDETVCPACNNGNHISYSNKIEEDYIDLGLPSGTKWATCNVGATKPQEKMSKLPIDEALYEKGYKQAEKDLGWKDASKEVPNTTEYVMTCIKDNGVPNCIGFHFYADGKWWEGYGEEANNIEYWMYIPKFCKEI